jgi:hypothetical protein
MPAPVPVIDGKRRCSRCTFPKPVEDFNSYIRRGVTVYLWCKPCQRSYVRGRPKTEAALALLDQKKRLVDELKRKPCADCERTFPSVAMDFDHIRGTKKANIAQMMKQSYSLEAILDEIAKCELVCANCHRVRTALRGRVSKGGAPSFS